MKKNIRKAIVMALVLVMAMSAVAQADTIISPVFRLPSAASRPTEVPTVEPTAAPTAEPTAEPVVEATEEPVAEITEEPVEEPEVVLKVSSNLAGRKGVLAGTQMILTLQVEGADGRDYTIRWQQTKDGIVWEDILGANDYVYSLVLRAEHSGMYWRACLDMTDTEE